MIRDFAMGTIWQADLHAAQLLQLSLTCSQVKYSGVAGTYMDEEDVISAEKRSVDGRTVSPIPEFQCPIRKF